jgi:hypothetical protein
LHGVGRGGVHADLAVPVESHEGEGLVDLVVDDGEVELVVVGDGGPVVDACAAQGIGSHGDARGADCFEVDDVVEVFDVVTHEVVFDCCWRFEGLLEGDSLYAVELVCEEFVGGVLNPGGGFTAGRAAAGWVVFEATIFWWIMGGRDDYAVCVGCV